MTCATEGCTNEPLGASPWCAECQLPDPGRPKAGKVGGAHPGTAKEAAQRARYRVGTQKARLLDAVARAGDRGLTNAEAAGPLGCSRNQTATRMGELVEDGWVEKARAAGGGIVQRATDASGEYHGEVYVLTAAGKAQRP